MSDEEVQIPESKPTKVSKDGRVECRNLYGITICIGDFVRVYPRSLRFAVVEGIVSDLSANVIVLENEENTIAIRLSEIKMLQKPKIARSESGKKEGNQ